VRRCHLNGKNAGADKQRKVGEKVAEIEFFEVGNHGNIVMGVFDVAQSVVASASGVIGGSTSIDLETIVPDMQAQLEAMDLGPLLGLWVQSLFVGLTMWALTICIFLITFGRMIEIYLVTSVAPIPMAAMLGKEFGGMGQNYL